MEGITRAVFPAKTASLYPIGRQPAGTTAALGGTVQDLLYIGLTIVVFAALWLLVKGVERFER
jgi:hypothetical protein